MNSGKKVEPKAHAVNPAGVSQIGEALGNHATGQGRILHGVSKELYAGKGFEAPAPKGTTVHHGGSQRKHGE